MNGTINPDIQPDWKKALQGEFAKPYFLSLVKHLKEQKKNGILLYPPGKKIFAALNHTPPQKVKVVILGQDPYHGPGQANGLCFSVEKGVPIPPSLKNIYKEIQSDLGLTMPKHGDLSFWAEQGVLLLNAMLTVQAHKAGSHRDLGWQPFTDHIISYLSQSQEGLVFMLWGRFAQSKVSLIDASKHHILQSAHPSPLSARGFFGCKHFSKANRFLKERGEQPIDWQIPA